jgi:GT2 family glycosyltransferase
VAPDHPSSSARRRSVAAIIVNYNAGPSLTEALASLAADRAVDWEIVVVDNASTDASLDGVAAVSDAASTRILRNTDNVGFGRAVNQGLRVTSAPWVLVMNPDCTLEAGAGGALIDVLEQHADCALVGPRVLDPDGAVQGSARGDPDMLTGVFGRTSIVRRWWPGAAAAARNVVDVHSVQGKSAVVDWVSGACFMARRTALEQVGGFDERYFLYWEDADLCRRLRATGWNVRYAPVATAVHQVGRSSRTARVQSIRAFHRSAYLYYATHVAPSPVSPRRLLARALLAGRCWWRLRRA